MSRPPGARPAVELLDAADREYIRRLVAAAPPPTDEQLARLAALLAPPSAGTGGPRAA